MLGDHQFCILCLCFWIFFTFRANLLMDTSHVYYGILYECLYSIRPRQRNIPFIRRKRRHQSPCFSSLLTTSQTHTRVTPLTLQWRNVFYAFRSLYINFWSADVAAHTHWKSCVNINTNKAARAKVLEFIDRLSYMYNSVLDTNVCGPLKCTLKLHFRMLTLPGIKLICGLQFSSFCRDIHLQGFVDLYSLIYTCNIKFAKFHFGLEKTYM